MDTGKGVFEQIQLDLEDDLNKKKSEIEDKYPGHGGWFQVGEILIIRGSKFRIQSIGKTQIRLRLLKRNVLA